MIIPSIDIMKGKAVQLRGGKEKVLESDKDPIQLAKDFNKYGEVAVIDLDAAMGTGNNLDIIKKICKVADCRVGGGIRSIKQANEFLQAGAKKIIIGTKASASFLSDLPKERIVVAIDTRDGNIVVEGWKKKTKKSPLQLVKELENYCSGFLFTNVNKEGRMEGLDFDMVEKLRKSTKNLTVAGGISSLEDIKRLDSYNVDMQIGMAIYTNKIDLPEAFISLLNFKKSPLIPTIVQDIRGQVLMLAFSNKESVKIALKTGKGTYYSRSRKKIWTKGQEASGNFQSLIKARYDCDKDTLLFTVRQKDFACHAGSYSCFGEKGFEIEDLCEVIRSRIESPKEESYTSKLSKNDELLKKKLLEEAEEVVNYTSRENLIWEVADLMYFTFVLMAKNNLSLLDIKNELWRRRK